jgi:hypothetical protein
MLKKRRITAPGHAILKWWKKQNRKHAYLRQDSLDLLLISFL